MKNIPASHSSILLLTAAFVLNHLDRHVLNITLNEIGLEFDLTDLQLGTLSGIAFAVVYILLGFPIAKMCRPGRRKTILVTALGAWSVMTMCMGVASNYTQLFLARLGVGIGEAGCVPPSHSMITDSYPPKERASALAFYSAGSNIGIFLSFLVGGVIASQYGWRMAFLVAGAPGIFLALVMMIKLREPQNSNEILHVGRSEYGTILRTLLSNRATRHVIFGAGLTAMVGYGAVAWIATFLSRTHDLALPQVGLYLAIVIGLLGAVGTWAGGTLADRLGKSKPEWRLMFVALTILAAKPLSVIFYFSDNTTFALTMFIVPAVVGTMFTGPTFAHVYSRLAPEQRAMATAIMMLILNLVGLGLGPVLVGFISDLLSTTLGQDSLRYALAFIQIAGLWGAVHFWIAAKAVEVEERSSGQLEPIAEH